MRTMNVVMPQIGMTMVAGVIEGWHVNSGDTVMKGDVIAEISTEKLLNNLEAPASGRITLIADEGETIECGKTIAEIEE